MNCVRKRSLETALSLYPNVEWPKLEHIRMLNPHRLFEVDAAACGEFCPIKFRDYVFKLVFTRPEFRGILPGFRRIRAKIRTRLGRSSAGVKSDFAPVRHLGRYPPTSSERIRRR